MLTFEIRVNGEPHALMGLENIGVLTAIVQFVNRTNEQTISLDLSALEQLSNDLRRHLVWKDVDLKEGDQVTIRILTGSRRDPPVSEITQGKEDDLRRKVEYYEYLKAELHTKKGNAQE